MAPLEGHTLGQRQKHYNQLLKQAISNKKPLTKIDFKEDDVDNMLKIDLACAGRDVQYILEVFKCDDMLYVSRAINKSTWLITDPQYANIINPKYLHREVFPHMNSKAVTKLMLHIRRHIKDEALAKAFYKYVNEKNQQAALSWLEKCSLQFVENVVSARAEELPLKIIQRLCRKSINVLRIYIRKRSFYFHCPLFNKTKYYLKKQETAQDFLDIVSHNNDFQYLQLNEKYTKLLIHNCVDTLIHNYSSFSGSIHVPSVVKYAEKDGIKQFILDKQFGFRFDMLLPFLQKLPREGMLEFLYTLYEVDIEKSDLNGKSVAEALFYKIEGQVRNLSDIYRWYQIVPFDVAFRDLKKFVFASSMPEERHNVLIVLLKCACYDFEHVKTVLQYYHDKHINEPYLHKNTFVKSLLSQHDTFRFDDTTWDVLNTLFHSLEVYIPSTNRVQECITTIIVRSVINDLPVNEVIEEKFEINTLLDVKEKLNHHEQEKLFNYLHKLLVVKIDQQRVDSETGMHEAIRLIKILWDLLKHWDKVNEHHRFVIDKIAELGNINNKSSWIGEVQKNRRKRKKKKIHTYGHKKPCQKSSEPYINVSSIYAMLKSHMKLLFENSIILRASEDTCLNALKHDPDLLARYKNEVNSLRCDDETSLNRLLRKLRVYWPKWAEEWTESNIALLENGSGHRALVRGIITLLQRDTLIDFIKTHAPKESKILWSDDNRNESSVQKHIARNMHIARPQLPAEVVLWYAKGDYLQYAHLSLNTMYHNLRQSEIDKYIRIMLDAPVSLQKHGIRLAFAKFKTDEILKVTSNIWKTTRNSSIRAVIFTMAFDLLCKEKKVMQIKAIWATVSSFIDTLNHEENEIVYTALSKVYEAPLIIVGDLYQKAYLFFETLPPKPRYECSIERILCYAARFVDYLDSDFVENKLLDSVYQKISCSDYTLHQIYINILSCYLLCSKDSNIQMQKYNKLLRPVIDECIPKWTEGKTDLLKDLNDLLSQICHDIPEYVFEKKMTLPNEILDDILIRGLQILSLKEQLNIIRRWQITISYIERLSYMIKESKDAYTWHEIRTKSLRKLAAICANSIAADEMIFFPSIFLPYLDILDQVFNDFDINTRDSYVILYRMLSWDYVPIYLLVLDMVSKVTWYESDTKKEDIKKKIYLHPSEEINLHYFRKFSDKYSRNENDIDNDDDSDDGGLVPSTQGDYDYDSDSQNEDKTDDDQDESQNEDVTKTNESHNDSIVSRRFCSIV